MSLFEDNAEYAYGYLLGQDSIRNELKDAVKALLDKGVATKACEAYLKDADSKERSRKVSDDLLAALEGVTEPEAVMIRENKEFVAKKSVWAFGGDGWAYDIGYGGLDHVLASGKDINILVLDTEVYSNTGGQSSKATGAGAVAKFSAGGKPTAKKDLGMMAMSYGYVYVACVAMSNPAQVVKAMVEAEAYHGPSLIIAYAPCINHGINMGLAQAEIKKAVECGYWTIYRYNPELAEQGKNPLTLDSKEPKAEGYQDFIKGEVRYASLAKLFPDVAQDLFNKNEADAMAKYAKYKRLAE